MLIKPEYSRWIFEKNNQISGFIKILPVRAELFREIGQTDGYDEAKSCLSQFCESAKHKGEIFEFVMYLAAYSFLLLRLLWT
jgi:hypothetical protein